MSSPAGPGRFDSGLLRKRGVPVLVELLRAAPGTPGPSTLYDADGVARQSSPLTGGVPQPSLFAGAPLRPPTQPVPSQSPPLMRAALPRPAAPAALSDGMYPAPEPDEPTDAQPAAVPSAIEAKPAPAAPMLRLAPDSRPLTSARPPRPAAVPNGAHAGLPAAQTAAKDSGIGAWYRGLSTTARSALFAVAAVAVLFPLIWAIAYRRGETTADTKYAQMQPKDPASPDRAAGGVGNTLADPLNTSTAPGAPARTPPQVQPQPQPQPADQPTGPQISNELTAGLNYLIVGNFKREKDAEETAAYLNANGVPAAVVASSELRGAPATDRTVLVVRGFPGGKDYKASEAERTALKSLVQKLGARWKAEKPLAPSDLSQPYFDKYK